MRKIYQLLASLLVCFYFSHSSFAQVVNGSFETWSGGTPSGWTTIDGGISVSQSTTTAKEGVSSAKIIVNTSSQDNTDLRQTVSVTPGQNYTFSVWVYQTEGGVRARLYVDGYRGYSDPSVRNQWQQITYSYTPSTSSIEVGLRFYDLSGFDGSEAVYTDFYEPTTPTGGGGGSGSCTGTEVSLTLVTDSYASETSWELTQGSTVLYTGDSYSNNTSYTETFCLTGGDYAFTIYDAYGDGICCAYGNGSYTLTSAGTTLGSGGSFGSSETVSFTIGTSGGGGGTGGDPGTYYDAAAGLSGYALKTVLYNIIKDHTPQGYSALWTFYANNELDNYYEHDGTIVDIYSENPSGTDAYEYTKSTDQCGTYSGEGGCYNREHSFPRSWFGGAIEPMNSDVHHIFPTDGYVNSKRSSYPYGEVGAASFTSQNGSKLGTAAAGLGYSGTVFEPIDEFKGDVARAAFYMATRYENVIGSWETNSTYGDAVLDGSGSKVFEDWALNMLISWHNSDPVSAKEIDRNEAAYAHQGNRNPFVDHPEYVAAIWGSGAPAARTMTDASSGITTKYDQNHLIIQHSRVHPVNVDIFNAAGQKILDWTCAPGDYSVTNIPVMLKSNSLYIIKVYTADKVMSKKLVVR